MLGSTKIKVQDIRDAHKQILNQSNSPSLCAEQTGWSPGRRRDTTPQRSDTSGWRRCYRGWVCGRWPSSSSPWWTTPAWSWRRPAALADGGPLFGSAPAGADLFGYISLHIIYLTLFSKTTYNNCTNHEGMNPEQESCISDCRSCSVNTGCLDGVRPDSSNSWPEVRCNDSY